MNANRVLKGRPVMDLTIGGELRRTFHLAALRRETRDLLTGRQWERSNQIKERSELARQKEKMLYRERFLTRFEIAQKRLIDEAGSKTREFKPGWMGADRFNKTAINKQAQRDVRAQHHRRLITIDNYESRKLDTLMKKARAENRIRGKARNDFNKTVDRRKSIEQPMARSR